MVDFNLTNLEAIEKSIPRLKTSVDYWLVRTEAGSYYDDFIKGSYIGVGWNLIDESTLDELGDNPSGLKIHIEEVYQDDKSPGRTANQILSFINDIKTGDLVLIPSESSEVYMLGEVLNDVYFEKDSDLLTGLDRCPFEKRRKVRWIKSFNKRDADVKIIKLSYRQQTVNEINEYKTIINRALYGAYIDDENLLHLTFDINIEDNINMVQLSEFLYEYTQLYEALSGDQEIDIKINAQSKGKSEIITKSVKGIAVAVLIYGAASLPYGGEVSIGGGLLPEITVNTPGIINEFNRNKRENRELELKEEQSKGDKVSKDLENIEKAMELAEKLQIPIEQLNIGIPKEIIEAIKEAQKENTTNQTGSVSDLENINTDK